MCPVGQHETARHRYEHRLPQQREEWRAQDDEDEEPCQRKRLDDTPRPPSAHLTGQWQGNKERDAVEQIPGFDNAQKPAGREAQHECQHAPEVQ